MQDYKALKRINTPGHARELTFSTFRNIPILAEAYVAEAFLHSLGIACERHRFALHAYVVMPDHVHLLGTPSDDDPASVSTLLATTKRTTSFNAKKWLRCKHPERVDAHVHRTQSGETTFRLWQPGGGYDRNVVSTEALRNSIQYIHANPVQAGLVDQAVQYKWSSARQWEDPECRQPEWMPKVSRGMFV